MKNTIYIILTFLLIVSCKQSSEDILKEKTENWIEKNANNPKSYEFVEFKILDTLNMNEQNDEVYKNIQKDIKNYERGLEGYKTGLKYLDRAISEGKAEEKDIEEGKKTREIVAKGQTELDSLIKKAEKHKEKYFNQEIYRVNHKFRINNALNAPMLNTYMFILNSKYEVLDAIKSN